MDRTTYLGSSDARDIITGDWYAVYARKKGLEEPVDLSDNFKVQLGVHTEEFHIDWTFKRLQAEVGDGVYALSKFASKGQQHRAEIDMCASHPDGVLIEGTGDETPVEVKHSGRFATADQACDFYMPQIQHHMYCWDSEHLLFSVILGNEEPERVWVSRSDEWINDYADKCQRFWADHIELDAPPVNPSASERISSLPTADVFDRIKRNGFSKRCMQHDNRATSLAQKFIETKGAVTQHNSVKSELKSMMQSDEDVLYWDDLLMKRTKSGSITFKIMTGEQ